MVCHCLTQACLPACTCKIVNHGPCKLTTSNLHSLCSARWVAYVLLAQPIYLCQSIEWVADGTWYKLWKSLMTHCAA